MDDTGPRAVSVAPCLARRWRDWLLALLLGIAWPLWANDTAITGTWIGDARLFNERSRAKTGPIPATLVFAPDGGLSGRVGGATIRETRPRKTSSRLIEYVADLDGDVSDKLGESRRTLVVLVTPGGPGLDADFHLKAHAGFDPGMAVGHFDVRRANAP